METEFKVRIEDFEGPLEILLDLIEKRKLHISSVSLSEVADDFINHINSHDDFPLNDSADFIVIASTLLLIKSKSLLPTLELSSEEEQSIEELEERLRQYQVYKTLSADISKMFGRILYAPIERKDRIRVFSPTREINPHSLRLAMERVLEGLPKTSDVPKAIVKTVISLEEMIDKLSQRISSSIRTSFKEFSNIGKAQKVDVIVSFLAMLELVKKGMIRVSQELQFDDIEIEKEQVGTPRY